MRVFAFSFAVIGLAGCSATPAVTTVETPAPVRVTWADVEDLDLPAYLDEPALVEIPVVHDVPARLMENRVDAGIEREVQGYRIQIYSTIEVDAAGAVEAETRHWLSRTTTPGRSVPQVYQLYRQPYYRIRVGDYVTRADAEEALREFSGRYRRAMVVPDIVTVRN